MTSKAKRAQADPQAQIRAGQSIELLKALHILTADGKMNQDSRRKLKQVYHLVQFIEPLLAQVLAERGSLTLVDHGAGKSYLGFILYDLFLKDIALRYPANRVWGIETRTPLVVAAVALAQKLGFGQMAFLNEPVAQAMMSTDLPDRVDVVTALHACDTATDDALDFGLRKRAKFIVLVPCCQAEVAAHLRTKKGESGARDVLSEFWRHPIHTREFGSQVTNVLRGLQLEASGYKVTVTELVGWEHSMKNELIIAQFKNLPRQAASERLAAMIDTIGLRELASRFGVCATTTRELRDGSV